MIYLFLYVLCSTFFSHDLFAMDKTQSELERVYQKGFEAGRRSTGFVAQQVPITMIVRNVQPVEPMERDQAEIERLYRIRMRTEYEEAIERDRIYQDRMGKIEVYEENGQIQFGQRDEQGLRTAAPTGYPYRENFRINLEVLTLQAAMEARYDSCPSSCDPCSCQCSPNRCCYLRKINDESWGADYYCCIKDKNQSVRADCGGALDCFCQNPIFCICCLIPLQCCVLCGCIDSDEIC